MDRVNKLGGDPPASAALMADAEVFRETDTCDVAGEAPKESAKTDPGAGIVFVVSIVVTDAEGDVSEETGVVAGAAFSEEELGVA